MPMGPSGAAIDSPTMMPLNRNGMPKRCFS
jgi:hypothetical protein